MRNMTDVLISHASLWTIVVERLKVRSDLKSET